jgi:hypothetical protein
MSGYLVINPRGRIRQAFALNRGAAIVSGSPRMRKYCATQHALLHRNIFVLSRR